MSFKIVLAAFGIDHLAGRITLQQLIDIFGAALRGKELTCADIDQRYADAVFLEVQRCKIIVAFLMKDIVVSGYAGGNEFGNAAPYNSFSGFWIFQLIADGHALPRAYQLRRSEERRVG